MRRMARLQARWPQVTLVHTPIHASWFNQIEFYCFSIVQRKVLTRNDFRSLIPVRIASSTSSPPTRTPPHHFRGPSRVGTCIASGPKLTSRPRHLAA
jgi:hypothetical protein